MRCSVFLCDVMWCYIVNVHWDWRMIRCCNQMLLSPAGKSARPKLVFSMSKVDVNRISSDNQPTNQPDNYPFNHPTNPPINQPSNKPIKQPTNLRSLAASAATAGLAAAASAAACVLLLLLPCSCCFCCCCNRVCCSCFSSKSQSAPRHDGCTPFSRTLVVNKYSRDETFNLKAWQRPPDWFLPCSSYCVKCSVGSSLYLLRVYNWL